MIEGLSYCTKHGSYGGNTCLQCVKEALLDGLDVPATAPSKPDMVNHPPHYKRGGMEAIDVIDAFGGPDPEHYKSTALKYILRAGHKGDEAECLEKAIWYLTRRVNNLRKNKSTCNKL